MRAALYSIHYFDIGMNCEVNPPIFRIRFLGEAPDFEGIFEIKELSLKKYAA